MPSSIAEAGYELSQNAISEQNERLGELRGRTGWYTVACLALGAEIVLWLVGAPDTLG